MAGNRVRSSVGVLFAAFSWGVDFLAKSGYTLHILSFVPEFIFYLGSAHLLRLIPSSFEDFYRESISYEFLFYLFPISSYVEGL